MGRSSKAENPSPEGFERIKAGNIEMLVRAEAESWSRQAVAEHGSLYRAALDTAYQMLQGRGPVPVVTNPKGVGPSWAVRRYFRGGFMRPLGDRFLRSGTPRSFAELETVSQIERLGVATPRIVAAAVYPAGVFYRADLVTEFVPLARTLADILFGENDPWGGRAGAHVRREALVCTGALITRLTEAGVLHKDLNANNVLIARGAPHIHATLLDLDRCRVAGPSHPADARALRRRLVRSIRKLERSSPRDLNHDEARLTDEEIADLLGRRPAS